MIICLPLEEEDLLDPHFLCRNVSRSFEREGGIFELNQRKNGLLQN